MNPQKRATHPKSSCWVSASAGTGKTKVLVDRILNLLLSDVQPESILCLTFTKAAAIEMQNRLTDKLQEWAILEDQDLMHVLEELRDEKSDNILLKKARSLLFEVLDTPGGMKIQTIHSFCQSLLQRFPLEAGIDPSFTLMEEIESNQLLNETYIQVLEKNDPVILEAFQKIATRISDYRFDDLLQSIQNQRGLFGKLLAKYENLEEYQRELETFLDCSLSSSDLFQRSIDSCKKYENDNLRINALFHALKIMSEYGTPADQEKAGILQKALEEGEDCFSLFLTLEGQIRKNLASKSICNNFPEIHEDLKAEANRLFVIKEQEKNTETRILTLSFMQVVEAIFELYQTEKQKQGLLDFEDLIAKTNTLLLEPGISDWVFYKLDATLDHILIDEAQDTNPDQWHMLTKLSETFLNPDKPNRTLFVVGDIKQSIYSFQGAKPALFNTLRPYFQKQVERLQQSWEDIQLHTSFRTTPAILEIVDKVFNKYQQGVTFSNTAIHHLPHRQEEPGLVELLPLITVKGEIRKEESWPLPVTQKTPVSAYAELAGQITSKIKLLLQSSEILPSTKTHIQPGDILILVRKRSELIPLLIQNLKKENIAVRGADRLLLKGHIAVMDLLALGNFLCLPLDDYNLACVLKSPLVNDGKGLSEEDLFILCHDRKSSLWESLWQKSIDSPMFQTIHAFLKNLLDKVDFKNPYELFHEIIREHESYFISRLGTECQDVLAEFLTQATLFLERNPPTLQGFMAYMETMDAEIKRSTLTSLGNEVRIMTIHGAKGLQSPIVILADSTDQPTLQNENFLWYEEKSPVFILKPSKKYESAIVSALKQKALGKLEEENRRLLYVALTRPQDRLYVAGIHKKNLELTTWYYLLQSVLEPIASSTNEEGLLYQPVSFISQARLSQKHLDCHVIYAPRNDASPLAARAKRDDPEKHQKPSTSAMQRGTIIHKLFELLPNHYGKDLFNTAQKWIEKQKVKNLLQDDDLEKVLSIITHPDYKDFFGPTSVAEVGVANADFMGRIDRLWVGEDTVVILDFKTSLNPAKIISDVHKDYLQQLSEYGQAMQAIYKKHRIRTFLLWTEGPHLMEIPYESTKQ